MALVAKVTVVPVAKAVRVATVALVAKVLNAAVVTAMAVAVVANKK